ncbi:MAG: putative Fis family two component sigma-54 specific transcriptional regulator [Puniceicoccaceae bacterium 5H]|nr:MAG: putative Fis family two component sigma-54 specific transcriptional regulator [Puniceicoccaceae bacterium 5H]
MNAQILIIDDEADYADMLRELLQAHGFTSRLSHEPTEAMQQLREGRYDLVISDFKMPGLDGADLLQAIRKEKPDMPVVIVSGMMNPRDLIRVANLNVNLVLEKPFNVHDLVDYVRRYVKPTYHTAQDGSASLVGASYPRPASQVSARSWPAQVALQTLWEASQQASVLPVLTSDTQEGELLARQLAEWKLGQSDAVHTVESLEDVKGTPGMLLLNVGTAGEVSTVADFIRTQLPQLDPRPDAVTLLIAPGLEEDWEREAGGAGDMADLTPWPALPQRALDSAHYCAEALRNLIGESVRMEPAATGWVLSYRWPGGLRELRAVMRRAASGAKKGEPLSLSALMTASRSGLVEKLDEGSYDGSLAAYLQREQTHALKQTLSPSATREPLLAAQEAGVPPERIDKQSTLENQPLWFPELLRTPWHEGSGA